MVDNSELIVNDAVQLLRELRSLLFVGFATSQKKQFIQRINDIEDRHLEINGKENKKGRTLEANQ